MYCVCVCVCACVPLCVCVCASLSLSLSLCVCVCVYVCITVICQIFTRNISQEGETPIHYAAELTKKHAHHEFEDTDMMKLLLLYDGDVNLQTKLVSNV